jgi:hypothetical protein
MKDRYHKEEGTRSKSGKTIVRVSKSGRKYYHNPTQYKERTEELRLKREKIGVKTRGEYPNQRVNIICSDKTSDAYMRYYKQKCDIRGEYKKWVFMSREEHLEYFKKLWLLIEGKDFQHWFKVDNKTQVEKMEDDWWERKLQKEKDYDGHGDEYGY